MRRKLTEKMEGRVRLRRWKAMNAGAKISLVFLGFMALLAVLAPIAAPHDPYATFGKNLEPGTHEVWVGAAKEHLTFLFGTDGSGRDILSRMLYGARYSLVIGLAATAFALLCGAVIGSVAAVSRKWISEVIMRIMDIVMSFPGIALAAVFISVFGTTLPVIILAIGFLYIPQITRVVRANVIAEYGAVS